MKLLLVLSLLVGQTIYEWVDAKGESHFTNDPNSIPAGAKRRPTQGAEVLIEPSAAKKVKPSGVDAGVVAARPPGPDSCAQAREVISQLEARRAQAQQAKEQQGSRCQEVLNTHGQGDYARCMAGGADGADGADASRVEPVEALLEGARATLRRAQEEGCR